MKFKLPLIAAFVAMLGLTACGGGSNATTTATTSDQPTTLTKTDTVLGTGADAVAGKTATVSYTGYLYSSTAAGNKGTKFDSGSFSFVLASGAVIPGFDQGVTGMKVGGQRTVIIPSSLGYGAAGSGTAIPANSALVFDIGLTAIQ
jgi:FKBP-type peptidyl-prolyl cis-trans isomerase FkpA